MLKIKIFMKIIIVGSGGNTPTPRISCNCEVCNKARSKGEPYKRCLASLYIKDSKTLIDCPEDISESLNRRKITDIDNLFITHWHPDHTFGFRLLVQANFDFIKNKNNKSIRIYMPEKVYFDFKENYPAINYFINEKKMAELILVKNNEKIKIKDITITPKAYTERNSSHYAYLIEKNNKKVMYAPCDTIGLKGKYCDLDLFITEQGYFSPELKEEISFNQLIERLSVWKPKKIILTHIPEDELNKLGYDILLKKEKEYQKFNIKFAFDGMVIEV